MFLRRFTGLLLALLTLHLNILGADWSCEEHARAADAAGHMHEADGARTGAASAQRASAQPVSTHDHAAAKPEAALAAGAGSVGEGVPCEVPAPSSCCTAMVSCSLNVLHQGASLSASALQVPLVIAPGAMRTPLSETVAPEPPPPKARAYALSA